MGQSKHCSTGKNLLFFLDKSFKMNHHLRGMTRMNSEPEPRVDGEKTTNLQVSEEVTGSLPLPILFILFKVCQNYERVKISLMFQHVTFLIYEILKILFQLISLVKI